MFFRRSNLSIARRLFSKKLPIMAPETTMKHKGHGSCPSPPQFALLFEVDHTDADRICCFNRHYAEQWGYAFEPKMTLLKSLTEANDKKEPQVFYDSVTGKKLF